MPETENSSVKKPENTREKEPAPGEVLFKVVINDLSPEQVNQFRDTLEELHLSKDDSELFQLIRALQIYKAYYETIPERIEQAAVAAEEISSKTATELESAAGYFEAISGTAHTAIEKFGTDIADRIRVSFNTIDDQIHKKGNELSDILREKIYGECESSLMPAMNELKKAGSILTETVKKSHNATVKLEKNINLAKWTHYGAISVAVIVSILAMWVFFHFRYSTRLSEERIIVANEIGMNQAVLIELSKAGKRLELSGKNRNLVSIQNAEGWTSETGEGVIQFH